VKKTGENLNNWIAEGSLFPELLFKEQRLNFNFFGEFDPGSG
jgi:hypothetical protein